MSNRQTYLAKQEANRKSRMAAGLVGDKFSDVDKIVIDMVYLQNLSNPILMLRKVNIFPTSYAYFKMDIDSKETYKALAYTLYILELGRAARIYATIF